SNPIIKLPERSDKQRQHSVGCNKLQIRVKQNREQLESFKTKIVHKKSCAPNPYKIKFDPLDRLFQASNKIAFLNFRQSYGHVNALLDQNVGQTCIRDAATHERRLFTTVDDGLPKFNERPTFEPPTPLRAPGPLTVDKLIRGANVLAQICDLEDVKSYISKLYQRHEEITSSIDSLESIGKKQKLDLERIRGLQQNIESRDNLINSNQQLDSASFAEEIQYEQREILALESLIEEHNEMLGLLESKLQNEKQLFRESEENDSSYRTDSLIFSESLDSIEQLQKLSQLREQLESKHEILQQLDAQLIGTSESPTYEGVEEGEFGRLKLKYESILTKADASFSNQNSEQLNRIQHVMSTAVGTLQQLLEVRERYELLNFDLDLIREINSTLVDHVAEFQGENHLPELLDNIPTPQIILSAIILQIIRDEGGELPLTELKDRIGNLARQREMTEFEGINALYTLVANRLITIDRSEKTNPVRANIWSI
ncbi:1404_t:CDS:10, partial [Ambispora leptoticha]